MAQSATIELNRAFKDDSIRITPANLYWDMSGDEESCRWQITDLDLPTFDPCIKQELWDRDKPARDGYFQAFVASLSKENAA